MLLECILDRFLERGCVYFVSWSRRGRHHPGTTNSCPKFLQKSKKLMKQVAVAPNSLLTGAPEPAFRDKAHVDVKTVLKK